ncbi:MAG: PAS domain S-box protein [Phycisphaerae bacterium]|jgi:PAS domain S-box-containing protein
MTKFSVLYVDDDPAMLELTHIYLEGSGLLSLTTIDSVKSALDIIKTHSFDAIVSDYQMPEMDGIEFLKKIRELDDNIPFILFTGKGREEVVVDALNAGADSYIQKGGNPVAQFIELEHKIKSNVERSRGQRALRESEKKYRQLVENAQESIFIIQDEKFVFYNPKFCEMITDCGFILKDFLAHSFITFVHQEDRPLLLKRYQMRVSQDQRFPRYSFRLVNRMGLIHWWEVDAIKIVWNGKSATLNFCRDTTEECNLREQLIESEIRYRELVETLPKTVIELDAEFNVTFMNRAGREKWGYTSLTNTTPLSVFDLIMPDDRSRIRDMYVQALNGNIPPAHGVTAQKSNGSTFPMVVYITPIHRNDSIGGFRLVCIDISESKKLRDQLVQTNNKLSLMCKITWHDLNNKFTALRGYLELAKRHKDDKEAAGFLQKIGDLTNIIQEQIQFTKTYQEIGLSKPEWQRVKKIIEQSRITHSLENIVLTVDVQNIDICADLLLEKVFYNLFDNSLQHGEHVTAISISCRKNGKNLILTYEDNGIGISAEDKTQLFTYGFGKHTGLGLFLIREILGISGISIAETGEPGNGARFEIVVPQGKYRVTSDKS